MRLLEDAILRDYYDVIVVGAGLGGMAAASLLAKRGLSVLMVEQQSKPGGSCTSFRRQDLVFDVGTAMIYGFGERGFKPFRFLMNELEEPIDIVAHPTLARMTIEGQKVVFWPDVQRFVEELGELFPGEREGIRAFLHDAIPGVIRQQERYKLGSSGTSGKISGCSQWANRSRVESMYAPGI